MNLTTALTLVRRTLGFCGLHFHEWKHGSEYVVGGVFLEARFCGIAACQRYEVWNPLTLAWEERQSGYPGL